MGTAELLLALDAGQSRVEAVLISAVGDDRTKTVRLALAADGSAANARAFITEDGDVLFGDEAAVRARSAPERTVGELMAHVGERTPIVAGGFAFTAEELVSRMVRWALCTAVAETGLRPGFVALTHPSGWSGHRISALRDALQRTDVGDVLLIPSAVAAARHAATTGRSREIAVYDLGGRSFETSVIRGETIIAAPRTLELGGADLDLALLAHVLPVGSDPSSTPGSATELVLAREAVQAAKERLSQRSDATLELTLGGRSTLVRLTRAELESVAQDLIDRTVDQLEQVVDEAGLRVDQLDEVVLVGGGSRLPLVAQTLSRRVGCSLTAPDDPQFATAVGAGMIAWERTAERRRALPNPFVEVAPERTPWLSASVSAARKVRIPYAAAAALVAAGVIIAAGMVFGASTPMNESPQASALGSDGDGSPAEVGLRRLATGFSAVLGSVEAVLAPPPAKADDSRENKRASRDSDGPRMREKKIAEPTPPARRGGGFQIAPNADPAPAPPRSQPPSTGAGTAPSSNAAPSPAPSPSTPTSGTDDSGNPADPNPTEPPSDSSGDPDSSVTPAPGGGPTPTPSDEPTPAPDPAPSPEQTSTPAPEPTADPAPEPTPEPAPTAEVEPPTGA